MNFLNRIAATPHLSGF